MKIDGLLLDVRQASSFLGISERSLRWHADKQLIPFRRLGRRLVFKREELEAFYDRLPGVSLNKARQNANAKKKMPHRADPPDAA